MLVCDQLTYQFLSNVYLLLSSIQSPQLPHSVMVASLIPVDSNLAHWIHLSISASVLWK